MRARSRQWPRHRQIRHLGVDVDREGDIALCLQLLHLIKYFEGRTELESEAADDILAVQQQKGASVDFLDGIKRCQSCYPAKHAQNSLYSDIDSPR